MTAANNEHWGLTDREKQTLRLMVRGHDAKSAARTLGLSVHTINERLRDARRKMAVSSSREAARLLLECEGGTALAPSPEKSADNEKGEDAARPMGDAGDVPITGARRMFRRPWIIGGSVMTMLLALSIIAAVPQADTPSAPPTAAAAAADAQVVEAARRWLALLDQAKWDDSYREAGASFRSLNTLAVWTAASQQVRAPLGAMQSRRLVNQEELPAPPDGYQVVKFATDFANKAHVVETVSLDREGGRWRVVGVYVQ